MAELRNWQPGYLDRFKYGIAKLMGDDRQSVRNAEKITGLLEYAPVVGDVMAGAEAVDEFNTSNYGAAGLLGAAAVAGLVPGVGDAAAKGIKAAVKSRGDEVLGLLKAGRAEEVTDDMLDMGNAADNANLNAYLFENYDLPMDEASRMARAQEMGLDVDAYHASGASEPFNTFRPGMWGSTYLAASPKRAEIGAQSGAQELAHLSAGSDAMRRVSVMPLKVDGGKVQYLRPNKVEWDKLPETADESDVDELAKKVGGQSWSDVYDEIVIRPPQWDAKDNLVDRGEYAYRKREYPNQAYTPETRAWTPSRPMLGGYNSGSDVPSLERAKQMGQGGFLVSDEAGTSIVAGGELPIRSRNARFDPRLKHLRNLSAGLGGLGLLGAGGAAYNAEQDGPAPLL